MQRGNVALLLLAAVLCAICVRSLKDDTLLELLAWRLWPEVVTLTDKYQSISFRNCSVSSCLTLDRCVIDTSHLTVYVQPLLTVVDKAGNVVSPEPSDEFLSLRDNVKKSRHFVSDAKEACLVVPGIDTLSQHRFASLDLMERSLDAARKMLPAGSNFLLYNFIGNAALNIQAVIASGQLTNAIIRRGIDIGIPILRPYALEEANGQAMREPENTTIRVLAILRLADDSAISSFNRAWSAGARTEMIRLRLRVVTTCEPSRASLNPSSLLGLCDENGQAVHLPSVLESSHYALVHAAAPGYEMLVLDAMQFGIVPVIISNMFVPPFSDELYWPSFSLQFAESMVDQIPTILADVRSDTRRRMSQKAKRAYSRYMSSLKRIVLTSLILLEGRILPGRSRSFEEWNGASERSSGMQHQLPCRVTAVQLTVIFFLKETTQYLDAHMKLVAHLTQRVSSTFVMTSPNAALKPVTPMPTVTIVRYSSGDPLKHLMGKHDSQISETVVIIDCNVAPTLSSTMVDNGLELWEENADHVVHLRGPATANDESDQRKMRSGGVNAMTFCSRDLLAKHLDDVLDSSSAGERLCYDMLQNATRTTGRTNVDNNMSYTLCSFSH